MGKLGILEIQIALKMKGDGARGRQKVYTFSWVPYGARKGLKALINAAFGRPAKKWGCSLGHKGVHWGFSGF